MRFQRHNGAQKVSLSNFSAPTISRHLFTDLYFDYNFKRLQLSSQSIGWLETQGGSVMSLVCLFNFAIIW